MQSEMEQQGDFGLIKNREILCIKNQKSAFICENKKCQKHVFVCADKIWDCQKDHLKCLKVETQLLVSNILQKMSSTKQLENYICDIIQKYIDDLSKFRDKIISEINQKLKYQNLNQEQHIFVKALQENNFEKLNGKVILNIAWNISDNLAINLQTQSFKNKINQIWKQMDIIMTKIQESIFKQFQKIPKSKKNKSKEENDILLFSDSMLAKTSQDIKNLSGFFGDKKIKSTTLLYRASQNNFLTSKFHQKCDNVPYTLTLVETEFGKIIGGYTPIIWNKVQDNYATDPQKRSFIFSLTNNQKLSINPKENQQYQILCIYSYGPAFGYGADLIIYDKANQNKNSHASIGCTYVHNDYPYNQQQSWKKFSGATLFSNFKIKQWQVWSLQFSQK